MNIRHTIFAALLICSNACMADNNVEISVATARGEMIKVHDVVGDDRGDTLYMLISTGVDAWDTRQRTVELVEIRSQPDPEVRRRVLPVNNRMDPPISMVVDVQADRLVISHRSKKDSILLWSDEIWSDDSEIEVTTHQDPLLGLVQASSNLIGVSAGRVSDLSDPEHPLEVYSVGSDEYIPSYIATRDPECPLIISVVNTVSDSWDVRKLCEDGREFFVAQDIIGNNALAATPNLSLLYATPDTDEVTVAGTTGEALFGFCKCKLAISTACEVVDLQVHSEGFPLIPTQQSVAIAPNHIVVTARSDDDSVRLSAYSEDGQPLAEQLFTQRTTDGQSAVVGVGVDAADETIWLSTMRLNAPGEDDEHALDKGIVMSLNVALINLVDGQFQLSPIHAAK